MDASRRLISPILFLIVMVVRGQPVPQRPRFEVATIKPEPAAEIFHPRPDLPGGRIRWTTQLSYLIGYAYHLDIARVSGFAQGGSIYSVEATFDPAATDEQVRLMLQSLLADRFKMRVHRVTTQGEGYALTIGKGGLKIKEAKDAASAPNVQGYVSATQPGFGVVAILGRGASMLQLAEILQRSTGMPVWDRTGLSGKYDFTFRYARDLNADLQADAPSLAMALQETLGLKLEKQKGPLETLIVDHLEEPSEN